MTEQAEWARLCDVPFLSTLSDFRQVGSDISTIPENGVKWCHETNMIVSKHFELKKESTPPILRIFILHPGSW